MQGESGMLNNVYNLVQQQNSHLLVERVLRINFFCSMLLQETIMSVKWPLAEIRELIEKFLLTPSPHGERPTNPRTIPDIVKIAPRHTSLGEEEAVTLPKKYVIFVTRLNTALKDRKCTTPNFKFPKRKWTHYYGTSLTSGSWDHSRNIPCWKSMVA